MKKVANHCPRSGSLENQVTTVAKSAFTKLRLVYHQDFINQCFSKFRAGLVQYTLWGYPLKQSENCK